jgi:hypothetical protein
MSSFRWCGGRARCSGESEVREIVERIWPGWQFEQNAGPSTPLRSAQDDNFEKGAEENRQQQRQNAVLRSAQIVEPIWHRCQFQQNAGPSTPLRSAQDDNFEKGAEENRQDDNFGGASAKCRSFDCGTHDGALNAFARMTILLQICSRASQGFGWRVRTVTSGGQFRRKGTPTVPRPRLT